MKKGLYRFSYIPLYRFLSLLIVYYRCHFLLSSLREKRGNPFLFTTIKWIATLTTLRLQWRDALSAINHIQLYYFILDNSRIIIAAASATFKDSFIPSIGICKILSTSSNVSKRTPVFSLPIKTAYLAQVVLVNCVKEDDWAFFSAARRIYPCSRHRSLASLGFRKDHISTCSWAHRAVFFTFSSVSGVGVNHDKIAFHHNASQVRKMTQVL